MNIAEERVEEVADAVDEADGPFVKARAMKDGLDMAPGKIGVALSILEDRGELELYSESNRKRLYRKP